jgi:hypothetical protein
MFVVSIMLPESREAYVRVTPAFLLLLQTLHAAVYLFHCHCLFIP